MHLVNLFASSRTYVIWILSCQTYVVMNLIKSYVAICKLVHLVDLFASNSPGMSSLPHRWWWCGRRWAKLSVAHALHGEDPREFLIGLASNIGLDKFHTATLIYTWIYLYIATGNIAAKVPCSCNVHSHGPPKMVKWKQCSLYGYNTSIVQMKHKTKQ